MSSAEEFEPRSYAGVMVSSSFSDLTAHRDALIKAIAAQGLHPVAMEQDSARVSGTVLDSSLEKVRDGAAYVAIVGSRYGSIPDSSELNPDRLSLTELEFREARRLDRPMLVFLMGPDHDVKQSAVEQDPEKIAKLAAFREDVKRDTADSALHRVYAEFNSLEEFEVAATQSVAELRRFLDGATVTSMPSARASSHESVIPVRPAFYAEPPYIGAQDFVGRAAQLDELSDWAAPGQPHPVLLYEAIGGSGKSTLTWEWATRHAGNVRGDWAGRMWYSFYERGAVMADFCRRALSYLTGKPLQELTRVPQRELTRLLLHQLRARPCLLVLDGLERVLVAYHAFDAAQLPDEQAGESDAIAQRDPCAAIRDEDGELLRQLAGAGPSKILITSRLLPRALINKANQPISGVLHRRLPGLRPADAEALLRTCGVRGDSHQMQDFLRRSCDCHPLVTTVIAGLVNRYLPARGDFDTWVVDPKHGGRLNLAEQDLVGTRNHILTAALQALTPLARNLLSCLSMLPDAFDYDTLAALGPDDLAALNHVVTELEQSGLLQYDRRTQRWDMHPVVRAVTRGRLGDQERDQFGQPIVDYFEQRTVPLYDNATSLDDLRDPLTVTRTLLQMGQLDDALETLIGGLNTALYNVEGYAELLALLKPLFTQGWSSTPQLRSDDQAGIAANFASAAFAYLGDMVSANTLSRIAIENFFHIRDWSDFLTNLNNLIVGNSEMGRLALADRYSRLALSLAETWKIEPQLFAGRLVRFMVLARTGLWSEADNVWRLLDPMGRRWPRNVAMPGQPEVVYLQELAFPRGELTENDLANVERLARDGNSRRVTRSVHALRGRWLFDHGEYGRAVESLQEATRMAREVSVFASDAEAWLVLARVHAGHAEGADSEAQRLSTVARPPHLPLAELWHALGDTRKAIDYALLAYTDAWADGEPFVHRHELDCAENLLRQWCVDIPVLPPYDPAAYPPDPLEQQVQEVIDELTRRDQDDDG
jgi:tetratricopeptide (TPR) repeat protein